MKLLDGFSCLQGEYLFSKTAKSVAGFKKLYPDAPLYKMGIGDVTMPLPKCVVAAMKKASDEMADKKTFKGYGDEQGYLFLRQAIKNHYNKYGIDIETDEIFVGDGAKSDLYRLSTLFSKDNTVLLQNPVYPAYLDINLLFGRTIKYVYGNEQNNFLPMPPNEKVDLIYLCSPNNPTGAQYDIAGLKAWVDYAKDIGAVIIFDNAYADYGEKNIKSIYAVDGADEVAIEVNSFSKNAGFTGVRCGYTIVPKKLSKIYFAYKRLLQSSFNGVSYITQCGALAVFTQDGCSEINRNIKKYIHNADIIKSKLRLKNAFFTGFAPYVFLKVPSGYNSWSFFEELLSKGVVVTPGAGFGDGGKNYIRLSAFSNKEDIISGTDLIVGYY